MEPHGHDVVQDRATERATDVGVAAGKNQLEAFKIAPAWQVFVSRAGPRDMAPEGEWALERRVPPRIVGWPVDPLERHADDLGLAVLSRKQILGDLAAWCDASRWKRAGVLFEDALAGDGDVAMV